MRILLVGLGSIGCRHLRNLRQALPGADITVLRQFVHSVPEDVAELPNRIVHSLDEALSFRPDAAIVANPATYHVTVAQCLAQNKVHLLVEKPLSHSPEAARSLVRAAAEAGVLLMVGYNFRFYEPLRVLRDALLAGRIGKPLLLRAEACRDLRLWRPGRDYRETVSARSELGGGVLLELSHEIDMIRWMLGEPASVVAQVSKLSELEISVEDCATALFDFPSGAHGVAHLNMIEAAPTRGCRIVGSEGVLKWDAAEEHSVTLFRDGEWTELIRGTREFFDRSYVEEIRHFIECVEHGSAPSPDGEEGLKALELICAAKKSAAEGRVCRVS